jgi:hypothetical protein
MKKSRAMKRNPLLILLLTIAINSNTIASETVSTTVDISESAINLFLNEQYNKIGFPSNISGNTNGVTYNIVLYLPNIKLESNQAKIVYGFKIESNVFNGFVEFEDGISFSVPSIDELTVKGISNAFESKVNSLNINNILKNIIISTWKSLQLEIYPMRLAQRVDNSTWMVERAIYTVDPYFSVSFKVESEKLKITLNTYLEAKEYYNVMASSSSNGYLEIVSGSQVEVKEVQVFDTSGRQMFTGKNFGYCPKRGSLKIPCSAFYATGSTYVIKILYKTSDTFYVRGYKCIVGQGGYTVPKNILN